MSHRRHVSQQVEVKNPPLASEILERRCLTPEVMVLRVSRPPGFAFEPGQRVKLSLGGKKRPYNIASTPSEDHLELCVERVKGGMITPGLWELPVGAPIFLRHRAKGRLTLEPRCREHLMVASVTGIAPFRSMLLHALDTGSNASHFTFLHGARLRNELVYREELEAIARAHPDRLQYVPVVGRPSDPANAGFTGETGDVSEVAASLVDSLDPRETQVYACGHPAMIADVRLAYRRRDFSVVSEAFWKI